MAQLSELAAASKKPTYARLVCCDPKRAERYNHSRCGIGELELLEEPYQMLRY